MIQIRKANFKYGAALFQSRKFLMAALLHVLLSAAFKKHAEDLLDVALSGNLEKVKAIISKGADLNHRGSVSVNN